MTHPSKIIQALIEAAETSGEKNALLGENSCWSYSQLCEQILATADILMETTGSGKRVGLLIDSKVDSVTTYFALLANDCVPFLIDPTTERALQIEIVRSLAIDYLIKRSKQSDELVFDSEFVCTSRSAPALHHDTVLCRFTSGSTGIPKCLEFNEHAVLNAADNFAKGTDLSEHDCILCVTPFSNGLAFNTSLLSAFLSGSSLVVLPAGMLTRRSLDEYIEKFSITRLVGFPSFFRRMLISRTGKSHSVLKCIISAAAALDVSHRKQLEESFGAPVLDYYGVAEVGPVTDGRGPLQQGAMGRMLPGVSVKTVQRNGAAHVAVKSTSMATKYLNRPGEYEQKRENGYFITNDVGVIRGAQLYLQGRADSLVKVGGKAVDMQTVLNAALNLEFVSDAEVSSYVSASGEPQIKLELVVTNGDTPLFRGRLRELLPSYMVPATIELHPVIHRNGVGKRTKQIEKRATQRHG